MAINHKCAGLIRENPTTVLKVLKLLSRNQLVTHRQTNGQIEKAKPVYLVSLLNKKGVHPEKTVNFLTRVIGQSVSAPGDANNYKKLKTVLLQRFDPTQDGFYQNFKENQREVGETVFQFVARLRRFFTRWTDMAKCEKSFDAAVRNSLVSDTQLTGDTHL